ncbi:TonB-dependent receptor plug domain-containing protein [Sulfurimonas sp.]|uniref:TonB-dependent receptor plug domain-containing protein n=1 Tax=Sulfurimonas sp. TaxID=2022749 RepID=UPI003569B2D4
MQKTIKLSLVLGALLSQLHATESKTVVLEPLSITSTAIKTDELKSTDAVEIYTQEDIEKAHVQNMYEFLNSRTSIIATPSYGNPFNQKIDMRGFGNDGYQNIVVTINGRKMNNVDMVPAMLSSISPSSVKKIEIIKSSGIVVGGDGANAGVINITTKENNDKEVSFYLGTHGAADASFYLGHKDEKLSISASGEAQKNAGMRDIDTSGNKDENKFSTGSLNLSYFATDSLELKASASFSKTDLIYGGSLTEDEYKEDPSQQGSGGAKNQKYDTNVFTAGIKYDINDNLSINIDGNAERKKSFYDSLGSAYESTANYTYNSFKANLKYDSKSFSLILGTDGFNGNRDSGSTIYGAGNKTDKNNLAGFIMSDYNFGKHSIKAGYRYEKVSYTYSDATKTSKDDNVLHGAELGYNYVVNDKTSIFTNYSHGYQAPDIDRFFSGGVFNDFIKPMESNNFNLGFNYITKTNKLKISTYYIDLKNEIYYYKDPVSVWPAPSLSVNTNIDKSHKYGLDIYDKFLINNEFNIVLNYNYVQAIIDEEKGRNGEDYAGNKLPGVSDHNVKATLGYTPNEFTTVSLTQIYRSEAYAANDFNNNFSQKQDPYMSTDISVTYAKKTWEVFAKINNIFNQSNGLWIKDDSIYPVNFTTTAIAGLKLKF